jgi:chromosome partitioning protein
MCKNTYLRVCFDAPTRIDAPKHKRIPVSSMKTLALISQKGGVGKTTLAAHLAVQAACGTVATGAADLSASARRAAREASARKSTRTAPDKASALAARVALIDADPQGSLSAWWNRREAEIPHFIQVSMDRLDAQLAKLAAAGDVDLVVIDTPPALGETIIQVGRVADLILIPVRPSPHDLHAVGATVDLVENLGRPLVFVVNGATARTRIAAEAAVALSQHGRVAPVTMHHRTDFASSMTDGRTVMELTAEGRSAGEVSELWEYVNTLLAKSGGKAARVAA